MAILRNSDCGVVDALVNAVDAEDCTCIFRRAVAPFGVDAFACGEIDLDHPKYAVYYAIEWPRAWRRFYCEEFFRHDPIRAHVKEQKTPFTWSEWRDSAGFEPQYAEPLDVIAEHGWIDGFVLTVPREGAHVGIVVLAARKRLDPEIDKQLLTAPCLYYLERMRMLVTDSAFPMPPFGLSPREIECLQLVAHGRSDRDIAAALAISVATAHAHVENAKRRLDAGTRAEAVSRAQAFGVIHDG